VASSHIRTVASREKSWPLAAPVMSVVASRRSPHVHLDVPRGGGQLVLLRDGHSRDADSQLGRALELHPGSRSLGSGRVPRCPGNGGCERPTPGASEEWDAWFDIDLATVWADTNGDKSLGDSERAAARRASRAR
jgi:hypothetical protein